MQLVFRGECVNVGKINRILRNTCYSHQGILCKNRNSCYFSHCPHSHLKLLIQRLNGRAGWGFCKKWRGDCYL